jgi:hypothetical protein
MNSIAIASISFVSMFGGALLGVGLRRSLPGDHLSPDSRDVVKLGAGLIATLAALVLGLMVSSAKGTFDAVNTGLTQSAANYSDLNRILHQYGPETKDARDQLRHSLDSKIEHIWPKTKVEGGGISAEELSTEMEMVGDTLRQLTPHDESQRILKGVALQVYGEGMKLRWSLIQQAQASIPTVFLVVLTFWFTVLFAVFTLLSPGNITVLVVMLFCSLSIAGGLVLILDMNRPFEGFVKVSSAPLENALKNLGQMR